MRSYKPNLWDEFVRDALQAYVDSGRLVTEEIEYKVKIGDISSKLARIAVLTDARERLGRTK